MYFDKPDVNSKYQYLETDDPIISHLHPFTALLSSLAMHVRNAARPSSS